MLRLRCMAPCKDVLSFGRCVTEGGGVRGIDEMLHLKVYGILSRCSVFWQGYSMCVIEGKCVRGIDGIVLYAKMLRL